MGNALILTGRDIEEVYCVPAPPGRTGQGTESAGLQVTEYTPGTFYL